MTGHRHAGASEAGRNQAAPKRPRRVDPCAREHETADRLAEQRAAEHAAVMRSFRGSSHAVLALQRRAGNAAVARSISSSPMAGSRTIQRQSVDAPAQPAPAPAQPAPRPGTAGAAPDLVVHPSRHGAPCACIVFIHNDERDARLTAALIRDHCSYNVAMTTPDDRHREILLPSGTRTDPNQLFPRDVVDLCTNDPAACDAFIVQNSGSRDPAVIRRFVQMRFFRAIRTCSQNFSLPVVALHNNQVDDTAAYRQRVEQDARRGRDVAELGVDVGGSGRDARTAEELKALLRGRFGGPVQRRLTEAGGSTNIFRWCTSPDIGQCHVGDPEHPDNVIWTTNREDFDRLAATPVNVVLQTRAAARGESATDLSTMFLTLRDVIDRRVLDAIANDVAVEVADLRRAYAQLQAAPSAVAEAEVVIQLGELIRQALRYADAFLARSVRVSQLRYVNIETPATTPRNRAAGRVANFQFILSALRTLGLECCEAPAEAAIESGLSAASTPSPRGAPPAA